MKILFIATFPSKHFSLYGKVFLERAEDILNNFNASSNDHIDMEVSIDGLADFSATEKRCFSSIKLIDYTPSLYGRSDFVKNVKVQDQSDLDIAGNVSKQIIRWSFKGMMQIHYLNNFKNIYDYIIYIDADTIFTKELTSNDLTELLPGKGELLSAVFRHDVNKYTETGWIAWNTHHTHFRKWVQLYTEGWETHIYERLNAYHDCAIFDWVCKHYSEVEYKNLSGGGEHGFNSGILGRFIDHKKGIRKHMGFSYEKLPGFNSKFGTFLYKVVLYIFVAVKSFKK